MAINFGSSVQATNSLKVCDSSDSDIPRCVSDADTFLFVVFAMATFDWDLLDGAKMVSFITCTDSGATETRGAVASENYREEALSTLSSHTRRLPRHFTPMGTIELVLEVYLVAKAAVAQWASGPK